jgi:hypothetical protein
MAAHSQGTRAIPPVAPDQPPGGYPQWLRDIAQSINSASSWAGTSARDQFATLPVNAANDTAAATAGVPVGGIYRNGSVLQVRVA